MKYLILLLISFPLYADERNYIFPQNTSQEINIDIQSYKGVALGLAASAHQFDSSSTSWQGSISLGAYKDSQAVSGGIGIKPCTTCPLFNGSFGVEKGDMGGAAAINFKF